MNEYDVIEELKRRSKEKGIPLTDEMIKADLKRIAKETEGLTITESIKKVHKMLEEDSKNEWFRNGYNRDL